MLNQCNEFNPWNVVGFGNTSRNFRNWDANFCLLFYKVKSTDHDCITFMN